MEELAAIKQRLENRKTKDLSDQLVLLYLNKDSNYSMDEEFEKAIKAVIEVLRREEELKTLATRIRQDYRTANAKLAEVPDALTHITKLKQHVEELLTRNEQAIDDETASEEPRKNQHLKPAPAAAPPANTTKDKEERI